MKRQVYSEGDCRFAAVNKYLRFMQNVEHATVAGQKSIDEPCLSVRLIVQKESSNVNNCFV